MQKIKLETYFSMYGLEWIDVNMHKLISKQIKNKTFEWVSFFKSKVHITIYLDRRIVFILW